MAFIQFNVCLALLCLNLPHGMTKKFFLHSVLAVILLFSGVDFVLKTHHIFDVHSHHDHDSEHSEKDHDDCKICDWAVATFVEEASQEFLFSKQEEYVAHNSFFRIFFSQYEENWIHLRGPPVLG